MLEPQWLELARFVLASSAVTTRFAAGHAVCSDVPDLRRAAGFAAWKHKGQMRKGVGQIPYIHHPIEVTAILSEIGGVEDIELLQAGLLHDTIEDTETDRDELETHFGSRVCAIVLEVSDDKSLEKPVRKARQVAHAPRLSNDAQSLKLADKISNVFDVAFCKPVDWPVQRQLEYFDWASRVVAGLRGCNPALEAEFDRQLAESRSSITV
ncbi:MAG: HD domain-containing protein [Gammaproteobacteria bacterium]|nr:HD domain-containing protein [Gammaproteobacteria bacterium]MDH3434098.1 HD domain-containing protein [Gammaproteobacteria bacterium]